MTIAGQMSGVPPSAAIRVAKTAACRCGRVTMMPTPPSGPASRSGGTSG
jgi:hypothetical protein